MYTIYILYVCSVSIDYIDQYLLCMVCVLCVRVNCVCVCVRACGNFSMYRIRPYIQYTAYT